MSLTLNPPTPLMQDTAALYSDEEHQDEDYPIARDFVNRVVPAASSSPDQFLSVPDKTIASRYVNIGRAQLTRDAWEQSFELIKSAHDALSSVASESAENTTAKDMLRVANTVMSALECVEKIHPWIQVAVFAFKGIMVLEIDRRENERRVYAVLVQASATMAELFALRDLEQPKIAAMRSQLDVVLLKIKAAIVEAGNAINKYSNSHKLARFFNSSGYRTTFTEIVKKFAELKRDLASVLQIHVALKVQDVARMVEHLTQIITAQTRTEDRIAMEVDKRGGRDAVLQGGTAKISDLLRTNVMGRSRSLSGDDGTRPVDAGLLHDLSTPLDKQLQDNRPLFEAVLDAQMVHIREAIDVASTRIIQAVRDGAWKRVHDAHLQVIWKRMEWAYSVSTQAFVNALREHYPDHFVTFDDHSQGQPLRIGSDPSSPGGSSTGYTQTWSDDGLEPVSISHKWCLEYLNVFYVPPLTEAFDDDSNGSVHVREVDAFATSRSFPETWPVLPRLAYAAAGWRLELLHYQRSIQAILNSLESAMVDLPQANRPLLRAYLDSEPLKWVKHLARGITPPSRPVAVELEALVDERIAYLAERLQKKLKRFNYDLSAVNELDPIVGKRRLEHHLLPLFMQFLLQHMGVVELSKTVLLDRMELEIASRSLGKVVLAAQQRRDRLEESFKQQGIDPRMRFETFAGGLYKYASAEGDPVAPEDVAYWKEHPQLASELGIKAPVLSADQLRYPPLRSTVTPDSQTPLRTMKAADLGIDIRAALDARAFRAQGPTYLTPEERKMIDNRATESTTEDSKALRVASDTTMRETLVVHDHFCTSCQKCPIVSELYECLECPLGTFRSCADCVGNVSRHATHTDHHNMILYRIDMTLHMGGRYRWAAGRTLPHHIEQLFGEAVLQCLRCTMGLAQGSVFWLHVGLEDAAAVVCNDCQRDESVVVLVRSHLAVANVANGTTPPLRIVQGTLQEFDARLTTLENQFQTLTAQNNEILTLMRAAFSNARNAA